ncbi:unnamed protein product, partial [Anisakis simplex]|uniref:BZIP domain-containing protein n=1 Tax=Anisakis simplex TaxID=6269 RepID=A0A0M3J7T0_ANISI
SLTPSDGSTPNSATICEIEPSSSPGVSATKSISTDNRDNQSPLSSSSSTSVHPLETANEYRRRRDKNNIASQRSRRKRQMKFEALKEEEMQLKKRNTELHASVSDLERQVNNLKEIMMKAVTR